MKGHERHENKEPAIINVTYHTAVHHDRQLFYRASDEYKIYHDH